MKINDYYPNSGIFLDTYTVFIEDLRLFNGLNSY